MVAERVLDTSAHKLLNKQPIGSIDVPAELQTLIGKEYVFKLKLNEYNIIHGRENFTVASLWISDEGIEKDCETETEKTVKGKLISSTVGSIVRKVKKPIPKDSEVTSIASLEDAISSDDEISLPRKKRKRVVDDDEEGFCN
ncbi:hypothetical protein L6452_02138 [Arctium lappa]|uniref:Uncharacterized protein n=1 Tax=Arctium lappa TaxID=4217 RepID=A0ACB9FIQ4_ARCLA|nr:hypothetical protein L6452_02138 [Arctium lappa]